MCFSNRGDRVYAGGNCPPDALTTSAVSFHIMEIQVASGKVGEIDTGESGTISALFSRKDGTLLFESAGGAVRLLNPKTGVRSSPAEVPGKMIREVCFSPWDSRIATNSCRGTGFSTAPPFFLCIFDGDNRLEYQYRYQTVWEYGSARLVFTAPGKLNVVLCTEILEFVRTEKENPKWYLKRRIAYRSEGIISAACPGQSGSVWVAVGAEISEVDLSSGEVLRRAPVPVDRRYLENAGEKWSIVRGLAADDSGRSVLVACCDGSVYRLWWDRV